MLFCSIPKHFFLIPPSSFVLAQIPCSIIKVVSTQQMFSAHINTSKTFIKQCHQHEQFYYDNEQNVVNQIH